MTNFLPDITRERWSRGVDAAIAALAALQHGVVARWQLRMVGISDHAIETRVASGRLHRVQRGVYAVGHPRLSRGGRRMASTLTFGADAAASHRAAGSHWLLLQSTAVEVTVPRTVRPRSGITVHHLPLPPDEVTVRDGIPVTIVPRTIFDLGVYGRRTVERALHEAEYRRYGGDLTLHDMLERYPHRKGAGVIRAVLEDSRPNLAVTLSGLEELFISFLEARDLPLPRTNAWLQVDRRWIRVDCLYEAERVIVELDGSSHLTEAGRRSDDHRDVALQAAGWLIMRVTKHALLTEPDVVEVDLRRLLRTGRRLSLASAPGQAAPRA